MPIYSISNLWNSFNEFEIPIEKILSQSNVSFDQLNQVLDFGLHIQMYSPYEIYYDNKYVGYYDIKDSNSLSLFVYSNIQLPENFNCHIEEKDNGLFGSFFKISGKVAPYKIIID